MIFVPFFWWLMLLGALTLMVGVGVYGLTGRITRKGTLLVMDNVAIGLFVTSVLAFLLFSIGLGIGWFSRNSCQHQWTEFNNRWSWSGACQIEVNGTWIPDENYREIP